MHCVYLCHFYFFANAFLIFETKTVTLDLYNFLSNIIPKL